MNNKSRIPGSTAWVMLLIGVLTVSLMACRSGEGSDCLTDSDCNEGLVCIARSQMIEGEMFLEKWGTCFRDTDLDEVPDDGDLSGSPTNRRCGVRAEISEQTGIEVVFEEVLTDCDDNCVNLANGITAWTFGCAAKDDCCPISADEKEKASRFDRCSDVTETADTCAACMPDTCYLSESKYGFMLDESGCVICGAPEVEDLVRCEEDADCLAADLPVPACSGSWKCVSFKDIGSRCKYTYSKFDRLDEDGYRMIAQLDQDGDGLGDSCDNCRLVPNGNCDEDPTRCDVDGDGTVTGAEREMGGQADGDGDGIGDACDLCPDDPSGINTDVDGDGLGDPCDPDDDNDGICDPGDSDSSCSGSDNCPLTPNPGQENLDGDEYGDACDVDIDGDEIREDGDASGVAGDNPCVGGATRDCDDNCPGVANGDQADADEDGIGDACE